MPKLLTTLSFLPPGGAPKAIDRAGAAHGGAQLRDRSPRALRHRSPVCPAWPARARNQTRASWWEGRPAAVRQTW